MESVGSVAAMAAVAAGAGTALYALARHAGWMAAGLACGFAGILLLRLLRAHVEGGLEDVTGDHPLLVWGVPALAGSAAGALLGLFRRSRT